MLVDDDADPALRQRVQCECPRSYAVARRRVSGEERASPAHAAPASRPRRPPRRWRAWPTRSRNACAAIQGTPDRPKNYAARVSQLRPSDRRRVNHRLNIRDTHFPGEPETGTPRNRDTHCPSLSPCGVGRSPSLKSRWNLLHELLDQWLEAFASRQQPPEHARFCRAVSGAGGMANQLGYSDGGSVPNMLKRVRVDRTTSMVLQRRTALASKPDVFDNNMATRY